VQAALTVIGRRTAPYDDPQHRINLEAAKLPKANLYGANLTGANLVGADLTGAAPLHELHPRGPP